MDAKEAARTQSPTMASLLAPMALRYRVTPEGEIVMATRDDELAALLIALETAPGTVPEVCERLRKKVLEFARNIANGAQKVDVIQSAATVERASRPITAEGLIRVALRMGYVSIDKTPIPVGGQTREVI